MTTGDNARKTWCVLAHRSRGDGYRLVLGIAIDPGADGREGDAAQPVLQGQLETVVVKGGEPFGLMAGAAMPHGADGMDHPAGRQAKAGGYPRLAGEATTQGPTGGQQLRPRRPMDGAIDSAATQQGLVGGVDDGIDRQTGTLSRY